MAAKDWDGDDDIKGLWVAAAADEREKLTLRPPLLIGNRFVKSLQDKSFNTHSRFALPKAAGTAGSCWNSSRYRKLLELLVRQSRPHLVAESARDRRLATACAVGTAGISHLVVGTTRVWLLELLAFGCCLCSRLAAACARVWLLILLVESRVWLLLVLAFGCCLCSRSVADLAY
ncbi:hypothetical protein WN944_022173 [Citrus x changshan-huyou]|uniref:Uncharacterized protein n=1 Tax=Citrus x changshan-huyou TaxID=2935761 RepID=A0AAP0R062_9ROSI